MSRQHPQLAALRNSSTTTRTDPAPSIGLQESPRANIDQLISTNRIVGAPTTSSASVTAAVTVAATSSAAAGSPVRHPVVAHGPPMHYANPQHQHNNMPLSLPLHHQHHHHHHHHHQNHPNSTNTFATRSNSITPLLLNKLPTTTPNPTQNVNNLTVPEATPQHGNGNSGTASPAESTNGSSPGMFSKSGRMSNRKEKQEAPTLYKRWTIKMTNEFCRLLVKYKNHRIELSNSFTNTGLREIQTELKDLFPDQNNMNKFQIKKLREKLKQINNEIVGFKKLMLSESMLMWSIAEGKLYLGSLPKVDLLKRKSTRGLFPGISWNSIRRYISGGCHYIYLHCVEFFIDNDLNGIKVFEIFQVLSLQKAFRPVSTQAVMEAIELSTAEEEGSANDNDEINIDNVAIYTLNELLGIPENDGHDSTTSNANTSTNNEESNDNANNNNTLTAKKYLPSAGSSSASTVSTPNTTSYHHNLHNQNHNSSPQYQTNATAVANTANASQTSNAQNNKMFESFDSFLPLSYQQNAFRTPMLHDQSLAQIPQQQEHRQENQQNQQSQQNHQQQEVQGQHSPHQQRPGVHPHQQFPQIQHYSSNTSNLSYDKLFSSDTTSATAATLATARQNFDVVADTSSKNGGVSSNVSAHIRRVDDNTNNDANPTTAGATSNNGSNIIDNTNAIIGSNSNDIKHHHSPNVSNNTLHSHSKDPLDGSNKNDANKNASTARSGNADGPTVTATATASVGTNATSAIDVDASAAAMPSGTSNVAAANANIAASAAGGAGAYPNYVSNYDPYAYPLFRFRNSIQRNSSVSSARRSLSFLDSFWNFNSGSFFIPNNEIPGSFSLLNTPTSVQPPPINGLGPMPASNIPGDVNINASGIAHANGIAQQSNEQAAVAGMHNTDQLNLINPRPTASAHAHVDGDDSASAGATATAGSRGANATASANVGNNVQIPQLPGGIPVDLALNNPQTNNLVLVLLARRKNIEDSNNFLRKLRNLGIITAKQFINLGEITATNDSFLFYLISEEVSFEEKINFIKDYINE